MADDFRDELPYPLSLKAEDPQTYLELTKMREAAEAVHGKETIERVSQEYRQMRAQLQKRPLDTRRKKDLQKQTLRLEQKYGYEGAGRRAAHHGGRSPCPFLGRPARRRRRLLAANLDARC
jgi:hypothetical protein